MTNGGNGTAGNGTAPALLIGEHMALSPQLPRQVNGLSKWLLSAAPGGSAKPSGADDVMLTFKAWLYSYHPMAIPG